jgi:GDP-4-dehydro-6-deoxy-D-mannose reductase
VAEFAQQVAKGLDAGADPIRVLTGSPDTRRDYTDVRDVVRAYRLLAARGQPGVWNVCSGVSRSARELVAALGEVAGVAVDHVVDPARVRPHEVPEIRGSAARLRADTGWAPEIPLARTLADTLAAFRR